MRAAPRCLLRPCDLGRCDLRSSSVWGSMQATLFEKDAAMNKHVGVRDFEPSPAPAKAGILRRLLAFLAKVLASPKGDQGGWEGGARGL
jgi:hypothetical protein